jgi:hypothetical protein
MQADLLNIFLAKAGRLLRFGVFGDLESGK